MSEPSKTKLIIVGGGSSGWMTAAYLSKIWSLDADSPYSITLIESAEVPPIGVGEATVHTLRTFLSAAGIQEGEFLLATDGTFKHGILFRDWLSGPINNAEIDQYFHSFESYPPLAPEHLVNHWLNAQHRGVCTDRYDKWSGIQGALAAAGISPKAFNAKPYEGSAPYGYHLDANKFSHYLKTIAVGRGVKHILGHIEDAAIDETGYVRALALRDGQRVEGNFFIDCSGFASVLMRKLGAEFISLADRLFVDKAVTARIPKAESTYTPRPYTTATARQNGWTFEIDLIERTGFGYIYSSRHIDPNAAEQQFRSFLDRENKNIAVNHISTRVGRMKEVWIKNCLAVGLSAGFLEPLESTGLYFIETALRLFVDYMDLNGSSEPLKATFNKTFAHIFDQTAQFIVLHYILTQRNDTEFWRDVKSKTPHLPELEEKLRLWDFKAPTDPDFSGPTTVFGSANYSAILFGMKRLTKVIPTQVRHISADQSMSYYSKLKSIQASAVKALPRHAEYLKKYTSTFS